jgi:hypothetical protein
MQFVYSCCRLRSCRFRGGAGQDGTADGNPRAARMDLPLANADGFFNSAGVRIGYVDGPPGSGPPIHVYVPYAQATDALLTSRVVELGGA